MGLAYEWADKIPVGVIYKNDRPAYAGTLAGAVPIDERPRLLKEALKTYM